MFAINVKYKSFVSPIFTLIAHIFLFYIHAKIQKTNIFRIILKIISKMSFNPSNIFKYQILTFSFLNHFRLSEADGALMRFSTICHQSKRIGENDRGKIPNLPKELKWKQFLACWSVLIINNHQHLRTWILFACLPRVMRLHRDYDVENIVSITQPKGYSSAVLKHHFINKVLVIWVIFSGICHLWTNLNFSTHEHFRNRIQPPKILEISFEK